MLNTLCWNELATRDADKATDFYTAVFGWDIEMNAEWGDIPPHWTIYFAVEDYDTAVARVTELGGKIPVLTSPSTSPEAVI